MNEDYWASMFEEKCFTQNAGDAEYPLLETMKNPKHGSSMRFAGESVDGSNVLLEKITRLVFTTIAHSFFENPRMSVYDWQAHATWADGEAKEAFEVHYFGALSAGARYSIVDWVRPFLADMTDMEDLQYVMRHVESGLLQVNQAANPDHGRLELTTLEMQTTSSRMFLG